MLAQNFAAVRLSVAEECLIKRRCAAQLQQLANRKWVHSAFRKIVLHLVFIDGLPALHREGLELVFLHRRAVLSRFWMKGYYSRSTELRRANGGNNSR